MEHPFLMFLDHTQRRTTVGRTPLDEWLDRRTDLYLTTHNTHNRQISIPPVGFEPTILAGELQQTYTLDRAATGTGMYIYSTVLNSSQYPRSVHVRFMVDRVALERGFLQVPHFSPVSIILPMLPTHLDLYIGFSRRANGRNLGTCKEKCSVRSRAA